MSEFKMGFKYMSDEITEEEQIKINDAADVFLQEAIEKFDKWLGDNRYENVMGMIIKI